MISTERQKSSKLAAVVFDLLNPVAFGLFVGALIFDIVYASNAEILWMKASAWMIAIGLIAAIAPRLINLVRVWRPLSGVGRPGDKAAFWLHLVGIVNAFVHSRDAYAVVPEGVWLSVATVALFVIGNVLVALQPFAHKEHA